MLVIVVLAERGHIDAREIRQLHGTHLLSVLHHGQVNIGRRKAVTVGHASVIDDNRRDNAVCDETRTVLLRNNDGLAGMLGIRFCKRSRFIGGCVAADDLDELHENRREEIVDADEALRLFYCFGKLGDAHCRGVGGNHRVRAAGCGNLCERAVFDVHPLGNGFDDKLCVLDCLGNRGVGRDAAFLDLRNRLFAELALGGKFVEALVNQIHTAVNKLLLDITEVQMTADRMPAL